MNILNILIILTILNSMNIQNIQNIQSPKITLNILTIPVPPGAATLVNREVRCLLMERYDTCYWKDTAHSNRT